MIRYGIILATLFGCYCILVRFVPGLLSIGLPGILLGAAGIGYLVATRVK